MLIPTSPTPLSMTKRFSFPKGAGGNVSSLKVKFNGLILNIRSQTLIHCAVDTCIDSNSADMFNKVNEAFVNFNKGMFTPNHKSYYHNDDLKIFSMEWIF